MNTQKSARSRRAPGSGAVRGENHHRAVLSDAEVDALRELWDEGGWSYGRIAEKFEISKTSAREIILCKKRA